MTTCALKFDASKHTYVTLELLETTHSEPAIEKKYIPFLKKKQQIYDAVKFLGVA